MVTSTQVSNYMASIYEAASIYTDKLVIQEKLGINQELTDERTVLSLLQMYVKVINEYFSQPEYDVNGYFITDYNFYTAAEAEEIMLKINLICDTNYSLDLE